MAGLVNPRKQGPCNCQRESKSCAHVSHTECLCCCLEVEAVFSIGARIAQIQASIGASRTHAARRCTVEFAVVDQQHAVVLLVCWVDVLVGVVRLDCRLAALPTVPGASSVSCAN